MKKTIKGEFIGADYWGRSTLKCLNNAKTGYFYLCDVENLTIGKAKVKRDNGNGEMCWFYKGTDPEGEPDFSINNIIEIVESPERQEQVASLINGSLKIDNDLSGNARIVVHYLNLGLKEYKSTKATRAAGLTKYRGKAYGGGFWLYYSNIKDDLNTVLDVLEGK